MTWFEIVGLIGVTIVITKGKIFDGLRGWLLSFTNTFNVFRIAGELLSCAMCSGVWVGFVGALLLGRGYVEAMIVGGAISLVSWPIGEVLTAVERHFGHQESQENAVMALLEARAQERTRRRAELRQKPTGDVSEDDAHRWLDDQDRLDEEVLSDPALVRAFKEKEKEEQAA